VIKVSDNNRGTEIAKTELRQALKEKRTTSITAGMLSKGIEPFRAPWATRHRHGYDADTPEE
jgi:hypothetical protein